MRQAAAEPAPPAAVFHRWVEALERLNRLPEAAAALAEGQSRFPLHPGLALLAARLARRSGAIEQAARLAREVIAMPQASPDIQCQAGYELGHALDAQDRCAEAYAAFVAAKEIQRPQAAGVRGVWRGRMQQMRSAENLPRAREFRRWAEAAPATLQPPRLSGGLPALGHHPA